MSVLTNIRLVQSYSLGSFALLFSVMLLHWFGSQNWVCAVLFPPLTLIERFVIFSIREFKQIATAGADTATGSKFHPK